VQPRSHYQKRESEGVSAMEMQGLWLSVHANYTKRQAPLAKELGSVSILPWCFDERFGQDVSGTDKLDTQVDKEVCQGTL